MSYEKIYTPGTNTAMILSAGRGVTVMDKKTCTIKMTFSSWGNDFNSLQYFSFREMRENINIFKSLI